MANIKSMKKDLRRNAKARKVNQGIRTSLKTYVKKARAEGTSPEAVVNAVKALDKAAKRGVIHPNQAARRKSRVMKAANKLGNTAAAAPKADKPAKAAKPAAKKAAAPKKATAAKPKAKAEKA